MVSGMPIQQTCNVVVVLKQRLASSNIFAVLCRKHFLDTEVSIAVELSLCISIFIGIPRSWYIHLRDNPT